MEPRTFLRTGIVWVVALVSLCLVSGNLSARADALDNWTRSQVVTNPIGFQGLGLGGVAYGNGRYVAVGQYSGDDNGVIQTSDDGMNWTMRTTRNYAVLDLYDVTFGNGLFVAVGWDFFGGNNIYHSTNGINWTPHTTAIANFNRVAFGNGVFVAVGDGVLVDPAGVGSTTYTNQRIYISFNGTTWVPRSDGGPNPTGNQPIYDVAYGAGRFVAVDGASHFYTSVNAQTWTKTTDSRVGGRINFCNGLFIAPTGPGTNLVSSDGLSWSLLTNTTAATFGRVIYAGGWYVALSGSKIFASTEGTNWFQRTLQLPPGASLATATFGARNFMAVGTAFSPSPTIPFAYLSDSVAALSINPGLPPQLKVSGLLGRSYRIEHLADVRSTNWQTLDTFTLTNNPTIWPDTTATNASRFYRAVLLP
ncbi:MAG: hypothetical protein JWR69_2549 [Pedosphaera sp.]|nr:hypothetical protein [Pedosphaera sp.]